MEEDMLEERILNDYKQALKAKDALVVSTLSFLRSQIMNAAIAKGKKTLDDCEVIAVVKKQVKQRQDSIEQFRKGGRQDLVDKETKELGILKQYLPEEMSLEELRKIIQEVVAQIPDAAAKDMGRIMKEIMAKVAGRADGRLVSNEVKNYLLGSEKHL
jgi:hypothetical protein